MLPLQWDLFCPQSYCPSQIWVNKLPVLHCGLSITSVGPDLAITWFQLINAWGDFANLCFLKGPSTNSLSTTFYLHFFQQRTIFVPRGVISFLTISATLIHIINLKGWEIFSSSFCPTPHQKEPCQPCQCLMNLKYVSSDIFRNYN